jgi:anti-sigma B factor antagonist
MPPVGQAIVMEDRFEITTRQQGVNVEVSARGEIDIRYADELADALRAAATLSQVRHVTVDLAQITFLDSTGIGALVAARRHAADRGASFRIVNAHGIVARVLSVCGVDAILGHHSDTPDSDTPDSDSRPP